MRIKGFGGLKMEQQNNKAWNTGVYQAWVNRFGTAEEAAKKIMENPQKRIGSALGFMGGTVQDKKIMNLMGSNGNKAVALSLLGAKVTVVDFSYDNEQYANELAHQAGVQIRYIVSDVLQLPEEELTGDYDIVYMEFGILHYFKDLHPLFHLVTKLLRKNGRLVLQDFHPISTKLISSRGSTARIRKHKVTGDYFDTSLEEKEVAYSKFLADNERDLEVHKVFLRNWTLGEIVTAIADERLFIKVLEELPNQSSDVFDKGIPKTFTIIAEKLG